MGTLSLIFGIICIVIALTIFIYAMLFTFFLHEPEMKWSVIGAFGSGYLVTAAVIGVIGVYLIFKYDFDEKKLEILKERLAKGEITKEEFENMKKDLENS